MFDATRLVFSQAFSHDTAAIKAVGAMRCLSGIAGPEEACPAVDQIAADLLVDLLSEFCIDPEGWVAYWNELEANAYD